MGLLNAAVWCGSAIFLVIGLPALFSPELKRLLTPAGVGFAARGDCGAVFCRAILVRGNCAGAFAGGMALLRAAVAAFESGLAGRHPVIGRWPADCGRSRKCARCTSPNILAGRPNSKCKPAKAFAAWHAASEAANLLVIGGLVWYLWLVSREQEPPRLLSFSKIRG